MSAPLPDDLLINAADEVRTRQDLTLTALGKRPRPPPCRRRQRRQRRKLVMTPFANPVSASPAITPPANTSISAWAAAPRSRP